MMKLKKNKSLELINKLNILTCTFLSFFIYSSLSQANCFSSYSEVPKKYFKEILNTDELLGIFYGCYKEDVIADIPYEPLKNCVDQSKKQIGLYDIIYDIKLDEKEKLFITVNDPFIGKERTARVRKICIYKDNELQIKTRFISINIINENKVLNLSFRFLFRSYFQIIKKKETEKKEEINERRKVKKSS